MNVGIENGAVQSDFWYSAGSYTAPPLSTPPAQYTATHTSKQSGEYAWKSQESWNLNQ
jgi:hypothetical protein